MLMSGRVPSARRRPAWALRTASKKRRASRALPTFVSRSMFVKYSG